MGTIICILNSVVRCVCNDFRYAKTAKKVDMRRIKNIAWSILTQASTEVMLCKEVESYYHRYIKVLYKHQILNNNQFFYHILFRIRKMKLLLLKSRSRKNPLIVILGIKRSMTRSLALCINHWNSLQGYQKQCLIISPSL